jgi:hypothetical protein
MFNIQPVSFLGQSFPPKVLDQILRPFSGTPKIRTTCRAFAESIFRDQCKVGREFCCTLDRSKWTDDALSTETLQITDAVALNVFKAVMASAKEIVSNLWVLGDSKPDSSAYSLERICVDPNLFNTLVDIDRGVFVTQVIRMYPGYEHPSSSEIIEEFASKKEFLHFRGPVELTDAFGRIAKNLEMFSVVKGGISLPQSFGQLRQLKILVLNEVYTDTLPPIIQRLGSLETLSFAGNRIKEVPTWIGSLIKLKDLNFSCSTFKTLPDEVGNLENLEELDLSENCLDRLPPSFGKLCPNRLVISPNHGCLHHDRESLKILADYFTVGTLRYDLKMEVAIRDI